MHLSSFYGNDVTCVHIEELLAYKECENEHLLLFKQRIDNLFASELCIPLEWLPREKENCHAIF